MEQLIEFNGVRLVLTTDQSTREVQNFLDEGEVFISVYPGGDALEFGWRFPSLGERLSLHARLRQLFMSWLETKKPGCKTELHPGHTGNPNRWNDYAAEFLRLEVPAVRRWSITSAMVRIPAAPQSRARGQQDGGAAVLALTKQIPVMRI
jgi:hypothetical protein